MSNESPKILTEEELKEREKSFYQLCHYGTMSEATRDQAIEVITSHRSLLSANAELSYEIIMRKRYEGFLKSVIRSGESLIDEDDFETFKAKTKDYDWKVLE